MSKKSTERTDKDLFGVPISQLLIEMEEGGEPRPGMCMCVCGVMEREDRMGAFETYYPDKKVFVELMHGGLKNIRDHGDGPFPSLLGEMLLATFYQHTFDTIRKAVINYVSHIDKKEDKDLIPTDYNTCGEFLEFNKELIELTHFIQDALEGVVTRFDIIEEEKDT